VRQRRALLHALRERHKLTDKTEVRVQTLSGVIEPRMGADGRVTVDMGAPVFEAARVPFDTAGLDARSPTARGKSGTWPWAHVRAPLLFR
jgi:diaminopimelate epimerase